MHDFLISSPQFLVDGPERDVVVSAKARYLRNLEGSSFPSRSSREESRTIRSRILDAIAADQEASGCLYLAVEDATPSLREALSERAYIDPEESEDADCVFYRSLALCRGGGDSFFINGSDHLRLAAQYGGLRIREAFERAKAWDKRLDERLRFAASFDYGYLTSRPGDCGSALRLSASVFLPGIMAAGVFDRVSRDLLVSEVEPRQSGDFFASLSARCPLGVDEESFTARFDGILRTLAEGERKTRERVLLGDRLRLEDSCFRSAALLRSARLLPWEECSALLGRLRAGAAYGIIPATQEEPYAPIDAALLLSAPGHMKERLQGKSDLNIDEARSELVRGLLPRYLIE